jgi:hypothetical protein
MARRPLGPLGVRLSPPGPGARREFNHTHTLLNPSHVDGRQLEVEFWWRRSASSEGDEGEIYLRFEPAARRYLPSVAPCDWELVVATTLGRDEVYLVIEREPFDWDDEPHEQYVLRGDIPGTVRTVGEAALDACEAELREAASRERRPAEEVLGGHLGPCYAAGTVPWLDAILRASGTKRGLAVGSHSVSAGAMVSAVELSDVWATWSSLSLTREARRSSPTGCATPLPTRARRGRSWRRGRGATDRSESSRWPRRRSAA